MPRVEDVTEWALRDSSSGPGEHRARVAKAKPAVKQTETGMKVLADWERQYDKTLPHVSGVLAYGFKLFAKPSWHSNMIRLIKGGHLRVCEVSARPPDGSNAKKQSPYGSKYYILRPSCPAEVADGALARAGKRRRR